MHQKTLMKSFDKLKNYDKHLMPFVTSSSDHDRHQATLTLDLVII
ncbi:hypothetical protein [Methylomonas sp. LL1]|nr:hypothetical protein [Methylomonas sp. LL1]